MKKQKNQRSTPRLRNEKRDSREPRTADVGPDPLESALGMAARIAEPYPEEAEAIENVIRFVRGHRYGRPGDVQRTDVLLALSIAVAVQGLGALLVLAVLAAGATWANAVAVTLWSASAHAIKF